MRRISTSSGYDLNNVMNKRLKPSKTKRYANRKPMSIFLTKSINGSFARNSGQAMLEWFVKASSVVVGRRTASIVKINIFWLQKCKVIVNKNSVKFLVLYLKACHVLVMQAAGGMRLPSSQSLGVAVSRTKRGIPRIVPLLLRKRILDGDPIAIRLTLTFLALYRVLEFEGKLKLSTITDPGKDWSGLIPEIRRAIKEFWKVKPWANWSEAKLAFKPFPIQKSASTSDLKEETQISTSMYSLVRASVAWCKGRMELIEEWACSTGNDLLMEYLFMISEEALYAEGRLANLGRLGLKEEAAGKVRVFAMVDPFTNWLLRPLHKLIFNYLRKIDQDGTFDQIAPIHRLQRLGFTKF